MKNMNVDRKPCTVKKRDGIDPTNWNCTGSQQWIKTIVLGIFLPVGVIIIFLVINGALLAEGELIGDELRDWNTFLWILGVACGFWAVLGVVQLALQCPLSDKSGCDKK